MKLDKPWKQLTFWASLTLILAFALNTVTIWALPHIITDKVSDDLLESSGTPANQFTKGVIRTAVGAPSIEGVPTKMDTVVMDCPDHIVQFCKYDISKKPLHICAPVPLDIAPYWSISFYAHNTDNFWVINDQDVKAKGLTQLNIILVKKGSSYERQGDEVVVYSPSEVGIILIRTIIPNRYSDKEAMIGLLGYKAVTSWE